MTRNPEKCFLAKATLQAAVVSGGFNSVFRVLENTGFGSTSIFELIVRS